MQQMTNMVGFGKKGLPVRAELFSRAMQYTRAGRPATTASWAL